MLKKIFSILLLSSLLSSCGEEILTQNTLSESFGAPDLETFQYNTCAAMRFVKPPVDILFVVDNSGSTLQDSFQQIKDQIAATVSTISNEFDYHVYIAPLKPIDGDNINGYPLIVSDTNSLTQSLAHYPGLIELGSISSQTLFGDPAGNNDEHGLKRVHDVIDANRSNGIFRQNAHTVAVMISNGDDNEVVEDNDGFGTTVNESVFTDRKQSFLTLANDTLNSESFRFISLVPHTNCNSWKMGHYYKRMSQEIYDSFDYSDDNTLKNSRDLCSGNYSSLFSVVNSSIHHELVGHKYDHWKISSASETDINASEITVTKVSPNGTETNVPTGSVNGFEYLGHKTNINTRYEPDSG
ncbi:MAG: vWA domain-containing protein, partial [Bacteriovoracaceae bacterium]